MNNDNVLIGKRRPGNGAGGNFGEFFYLKSGINTKVDNIYRILPPVHSLAQHGKYAKYHAIHKNLRGTPSEKNNKGAYFPFACIQEKDKNGIITRHCPLCDRVFELDAQLKLAKDQGASKDQMQDFRMAQIMPIQSDKKYYLNVVNQENKIGVLPITYTMFQALEHLMAEFDSKGIDLTGQEAPFLNFTVTQKYKGDQDAVHKVDAFLAPSTDGSFRYVSHAMTPDFIERMRTEARDLTKLFREIDVESLAALAVGDGVTRAGIIDRIISASEEAKGTAGAPMTATIPGTTAMAVSNVEIKNGQVHVHTPADLLVAASNTVNQTVSATPTQSPNTLAAAAVTAPAPATPKPAKILTDAEFMNMFAPKQG
jgi:hypothetical protein